MSKITYCYRRQNTFYRLDENKQLRFIEKRCAKCLTFFLITQTPSKLSYCKECKKILDARYKKILYADLHHYNKKRSKGVKRKCLGCFKEFLSKSFGNRYCEKCKEEIELAQETLITYKIRTF